MVSQNDTDRSDRLATAHQAVPAGVTLAGTGERRYRISELAREFGVTPRALRFYEAQGLLNPERRGQHRLYTQRDRARLAWILRGKRVGFSLAEIKELIDAYDLPDHRETQRRLTLEKCRERIAALERQRADIEQVIAELTAFTRLIEEVLADPACEEEARRRFHEATGGAVGKPVPKERLEAALKQMRGTRPSGGNGAQPRPSR